MAQDAGLGRGTESPYLDILNHLGIMFDEHAPMGVSEEQMLIIGPDSTIRRLESEWEALEDVLKEKYGDSAKATGADGKMRKQKANELRAARQRWRRKAGTFLRKDHFKKRNRMELDRQLRGIHEPQQLLEKVIFSLPERRHLAEILGDLDEDLPEIEIVQRKIDAINAWVDYAWKIEPKEVATSQKRGVRRMPLTEIPTQAEAPQAMLQLPMRGRTVPPKPRYISMIQTPVDTTLPMPSDTAMVQDPPPPYSEVDMARVPGAAVLGAMGTVEHLVAQKPTPKSHKCFFCERCFTRKGNMWNCEERHLRRRTGDVVSCPDPDCKRAGIVLENELRFKNHAKFDHGHEMRPLVTTNTSNVRLDDYSGHVSLGSLTRPYDRPADLGLFEPLSAPGESCIPPQGYSVLELGNDPWISPTCTPVDTCIEDASLVTMTSSLIMFDEDPIVSELIPLGDTLPQLTEPDTTWLLQSPDILIDPLLSGSGPVSPEPLEFSEWEDIGILSQSPLANDALLGPASPESSAQVIDTVMQGTDEAIRMESLDDWQVVSNNSREASLAGNTIGIDTVMSGLDEAPQGPAYVVNGEEFWNVEHILDRRTRRKGRRGRPTIEYLVRWENRGEEHKMWDDTWEPRTSLMRDVPNKVREFDKAYLSRRTN